jgi:hypothetical protein
MARLKADAAAVAASPHRWRLSRGGLLNIWQYDDQVFDFADGRLLLRGTNGAGKSKTLEMLLPFVLDADRARMDASGRRGATLLWLMLDGFDGTLRTGYLWVELARNTEDGGREQLTLGLGIRASRSTRTVTLWSFIVPGRIGTDLILEDANGPMSGPSCREAVTDAQGEFFDSPRAYKAAVGRKLFGLDEASYDDLLRLLYWLRSPQIGESVEIAELSRTLAMSLPELDRAVVQAAADNLDALAEFGEQVERRERSVEALQRALAVYCRYAASEVSRRVGSLLDARTAAVTAGRAHSRAEKTLEQAVAAEQEAIARAADAAAAVEAADARLHQLETSQAARDLESLQLLEAAAEQARRFADERAAQAATEAERVSRARAEVERDSLDLSRRLGLLASAVDHAELARLALPGLAEPRIEALGEHRSGLEATSLAVGSATALVAVCLGALTAVEEAQGKQHLAEERAAGAAGRADEAQAMAAQAEQDLADGEEALARGAADWLGRAPFPVDDRVPDAADFVSWRGLLVAPVLARCDARLGGLAGRLDQLDRELVALAVQQRDTEAERDPAPPLPVLARTPRDGTGLPFWRLVDIRPSVSEQDRAGLEAALQSAGLLDALVLPDGTVLDGDDVVLRGGLSVSIRPASELLLSSVPEGSPVLAEVVDRLLASISSEPATDGDFVSVEGSWRLGALSGKASKPQAQYLGATARAQERQRRLLELAALVAEVQRQRAELLAEQDGVVAQRTAAVDWSVSMPDPAPVLRARPVWRDRVRAREAALAAAAEAERRAIEHRERTATARRELARLAANAGLPDDRPGLAAREARLRRLSFDLGRALPALDELVAARLRAASRVEEVDRLQESADRSALAATEAGADAARSAAAYDARREALSATQLELARALSEAAEDQVEARRASKDSVEGRVAAARTLEQAEAALSLAQQAKQDVEHRERFAHDAAAALHRAPGLTLAALAGQDVDPEDWPALQAAVRDTASADPNALLAAHRDLMSGPAGHLQMQLGTVAGDLYVVTGRDDEGEAPLAGLTARLSARVAHDRTLLTAQQREVCEKHLLGELGEVLRKRRLDALLLVAHMNALLEGVRTSQGIQARLDWRMREDAPDAVRGTVGLLERPLGSLLPVQREQLLELLSSLIEAARREAPDAGYAEHLRNALDYRTWNEFSVLIRRPGADNEERLSRRTALSQGEQKVVCYLPLFAAAAAHFTSLAAEAPLAPRFVLLDDAFPKIDVRTHPVLFGLLVDLELDWVVTSERLWGDYPTVPAVAIYEVLRSSQERGVLPYKHLWDGRSLRAVGG